MKKLLFVAFVFVAGTLVAQDVIITKDGDPIKVWGLEQSSTAVFYRESENPDAPIVRMNKADLLMVKYQDGRKELIGEMSENKQAQPAPVAVQVEPVEDNAANEAAIREFNAYNDVTYNGKKSDKSADMLYCILKATPTSVITDKNLEVSVRASRKYNTKSKVMDTPNNHVYGCTFIVQLRNKSARTVYVDLGTSFFIRGSQATPLYVPQATTSTTTQSSGTSVNMGAVARAMGVGGAVGTLASGVNVGGGSTSGTSTVTYSQRIIAIPPYSTQVVDELSLFPEGSEYLFGSGVTVSMRNAVTFGSVMEWNFPGSDVATGEERELPMDGNPICFAFHFTYAMSEDMVNSHTINLQLYTGKVIGARRRSAMVSNLREMEHDIFPEKFRDMVSYMCVQR